MKATAKKPLHPNHKNPGIRKVSDDEREVAWDELVRLRIRGCSIKECAEQLGFGEFTIFKWLHKPAFELKLKRTREQIFNQVSPTVETLAEHAIDVIEKRIEEVMERYSTEAILKIRQTMHDSENEGVALKAAIDLADRGQRTAKTKKVQGTVGVSFLTPELLMAAAKAARVIQENESVGRVVLPLPLDESMNPDVPLHQDKEMDDDGRDNDDD